MRVLILENSKNESLEVMEIIDIGFDDDITNIKDEDGNYDRFNEEPIMGLYMTDAEGDRFYIKGVSQADCNKICKEILAMGYADLSQFGEYEYDD